MRTPHCDRLPLLITCGDLSRPSHTERVARSFYPRWFGVEDPSLHKHDGWQHTTLKYIILQHISRIFCDFWNSWRRLGLLRSGKEANCLHLEPGEKFPHLLGILSSYCSSQLSVHVKVKGKGKRTCIAPLMKLHLNWRSGMDHTGLPRSSCLWHYCVSSSLLVQTAINGNHSFLSTNWFVEPWAYTTA